MQSRVLRFLKTQFSACSQLFNNAFQVEEIIRTNLLAPLSRESRTVNQGTQMDWLTNALNRKVRSLNGLVSEEYAAVLKERRAFRLAVQIVFERIHKTRNQLSTHDRHLRSDRIQNLNRISHRREIRFFFLGHK